MCICNLHPRPRGVKLRRGRMRRQRKSPAGAGLIPVPWYLSQGARMLQKIIQENTGFVKKGG